MIGFAGKTIKLVRFYDWWNAKIAYLFLPFYFLLHGSGMDPVIAIAVFTLLLSYLVSTAAFGHIVNDIGDAKPDHDSSRYNFALLVSRKYLYTALFLCILFSVVVLMLLKATIVVYVLALVELVLFAIYSLPPLRLKESYVGILIDSFYAHVVPFSIVTLIFYDQYGDSINAYVMIFMFSLIWQFASGIRGIMHHQIEDLENDLQSGTLTAIVKMGAKRAESISTYIVSPVEFIVLVTLLLISAEQTMAPAAGFLIYSILFSIWLYIKGGGYHRPISIYFWTRYLDYFYRKWLPLLILVSLVWEQYLYWPLLLMHVMLFGLPMRVIR